MAFSGPLFISRSSPLGEQTFTVRLPSLVVTTTFETRGLSLKVRVSVFTPFSFVVVISELSGPGAVTGAVFAVSVLAVLAVAFELLPLEQPATSAIDDAVRAKARIL